MCIILETVKDAEYKKKCLRNKNYSMAEAKWAFNDSLAHFITSKQYDEHKLILK
jgi:hypothetical protein